MSRLTIEIDAEQHRQIKTLATFEGMSMKSYILSKLLPSRQPEQDTTDKILSSPVNKADLIKALETPSKDYINFESIEELKDALKI